jgi:hypothetical protein
MFDIAAIALHQIRKPMSFVNDLITIFLDLPVRENLKLTYPAIAPVLGTTFLFLLLLSLAHLLM